MNQDVLDINENINAIPKYRNLKRLRQLVATAILGICGSTVAGAGCSSEESKNACDRAIEKIKDCGIDPSDFEWNDPNCSSVDECAANCWLTVSCEKIIEDRNIDCVKACLEADAGAGGTGGSADSGSLIKRCYIRSSGLSEPNINDSCHCTNHNVCHEDNSCWGKDYYAFECPDNTSCCYEESPVSGQTVLPECHCYEEGGLYFGPNHSSFKTCEEFLANIAEASDTSTVQVPNCP